jgi:hypothetical protein
MRRYWVVALAVLTLLGVLSPPAFSQAPAPKVTISGLVDNLGTVARNLSTYDFNYNRNTDAQMYGRTRGRFDIIGEVGKAKAVLGLEIDSYWGQTGFSDSNAAGCVAGTTTSAVTCGAVGSGSESSFDLNTDTQANIQVKWLYTELPVPLIPWATTMTVGAMPFGSAATYKLAAYANGDFAGVKLVSTVTPNLKLLFTFVAVEENLTGKRDFAGVAGAAVAGSNQPQHRGDDFALIFSAEHTPMKGLDVKPMYSYFYANGVTSANSRQGRGGQIIASSTAASSPFAPNILAGVGTVGGSDGVGTGVSENRHTVGVDARWRSGPWSLDPTFLYQFGDRDAWLLGGQSAPYGTALTKRDADISAWLVDLRGGYQTGPWTFQGLFVWSSGNRAQDNPYNDVNYFQPLTTDTSYQGDWGTQIYSLGIDYYQILYGGAAQAGLNPGVAIGYDKYGRMQGGLKAAYAWTPALSTGLGVTSIWTDKSVDTDGFLVANGGIQPNWTCRTTGNSCRPEGDSDYLGTELNASLTWRFAPGLAFDWAIGYLFAGNGLGHRFVGAQYGAAAPPTPKDIGVSDVITSTARVRYTF